VKKYILKRLCQSIICLIGVTLIVFYLTRISGDPVLLMVPPGAAYVCALEFLELAE
jgi:peptide/nickel transport system permease protein